MQRSGVPVQETLPLLAALLSLPHPAGYPPLALSPERQKQQAQEALMAWLAAEAEQQPVLAVWEDLALGRSFSTRVARAFFGTSAHRASANPADLPPRSLLHHGRPAPR